MAVRADAHEQDGMRISLGPGPAIQLMLEAGNFAD